MIVDAVSEVLRVSGATIEPPSPIVSSIDSDFISGVCKLNKDLIIMLDVSKIFLFHELEALPTAKD